MIDNVSADVSCRQYLIGGWVAPLKICRSLGIIIPKTAEPLENETFAFNQQHI